jgi:hypothetical protein
MTKPAEPIAEIERIQAVLAKGDASLAQLQGCERDLKHVLADAENEHEEIGSRRKIELLAHVPAAEIDKRLNVIEQRERAIARWLEIGRAVLAQISTRIDDALEEARAAKRRSDYAAALALHDETTNRIRECLDRIGPEVRAVLQAYVESERATSVANADLPPGASRIPSIEAERMGAPPPPKITERRFQAFMHGRDPVAEVGTVEAHNVNGSWAVYRPSRSVQGDVVIPHCVVAEFVEVTTQKHEPRPLEALASSLRVPPFSASPPNLGRPERKTMPLAEWLRMNGEPAEAVPALAAE